MAQSPVPPNNADWERAVLGGMLMPNEGPGAVQKAVDMGLSCQHFYQEKHQKTLKAILALHDRGEPVELHSVTAELMRNGDLELAGGVLYIDEMIDSVPSAANVGYYIDELKELATRRAILRQGHKLRRVVADANNPTVSNGEIVSGIQEIIDNIDEILKREETSEATSSMIIDAETLYRDDIEFKPHLIGNGLIPSHGYAVLGGYTKEGKTTLGIQLSLCVVSGTPFLSMFPVDNPGRVLFIHLENPSHIVQNILRRQVDGWGAPIENIADLMFWEAQGLCISRAEDRRALITEMDKTRPDLVVIDPVSLMYTRDLNDYSSVRTFVETLKKVSSRFDCAFLLIHHFGKPGIVKRESVHAMIGSSAWGNFAESVMGLDRYSLNRPANYKKLDFRLRTDRTPEPICLHRNPDTLLFELVEDPDHVSAARVDQVVDILAGYGQPISYTLFRNAIMAELGLGERRAATLIKSAVERSKVVKDPGRYGKYFVFECTNSI